MLAGILAAAVAFGALAGRVAAIPTASTQTTPSPEDVAAGMRIFRQKGDCQACHGWAADGRKMESQMPDGPSLRTTQLNRTLLTDTIRCGRPGAQMPAFLDGAYTAIPCYGLPKGPPPPGLELTPVLSSDEIEALVDYLMAKIVGK